MKRKSIQGADSTEHLALEVLNWLVADEDRVAGFLNASGMDVPTMRASLREPGFLGAVLDYVMGDEPALIACAESLDVSPERIAAAWRRLSAHEPDDPFS